MRAAGALMICLACLMYCLRYSRAAGARLRELDCAAYMLELTAAELESRLTPLPELARKLSQSLGEPASGFLIRLMDGMDSLGEKSFSGIWSECAKLSFGALEEDELSALSELGTSLGRYDIDSQLSAIALCAAKLRNGAASCRTQTPEKRRLHLGLACSAAAILVVLLI